MLDRIDTFLESPSRPDLILAGMPPAFLVTYLIGTRLLPDSLTVAIASLVSAAFVVDGLFRRPPPHDSDGG